MPLPEDHPVALARRLLAALNAEEVDEARALLAEMVDRLGVVEQPVERWRALAMLPEEGEDDA